MSFVQDMGVWRCTDCNDKISDPYYLGEDMLCKDCFDSVKSDAAKDFVKIRNEIRDATNHLDRVMDNYHNTFSVNSAEVMLSNAIERIGDTIEELR